MSSKGVLLVGLVIALMSSAFMVQVTVEGTKFRIRQYDLWGLTRTDVELVAPQLLSYSVLNSPITSKAGPQPRYHVYLNTDTSAKVVLPESIFSFALRNEAVDAGDKLMAGIKKGRYSSRIGCKLWPFLIVGGGIAFIGMVAVIFEGIGKDARYK